MKRFGLLLLFAAFGLWGISKVLRLHRRADDLRELCRVLTTLQGEIGWRQADLYSIAAAHDDLPFFARWAKAMQSLPPSDACLSAAAPMALAEADRRLLREFADCAGKTDRAGQLSRLEQLRIRLEQQAAEAREESQSKGRVQLMLALCVGGTVCLVLL